jgi:outer membrane receptor protein involved in Fe transport
MLMMAEFYTNCLKILISALILFFFILPDITFSQQAEIKGIVTDGGDGMPLPGVNILLDTNGGVASDQEGRYSITVAPGRHTLTYRFVGYQTVIRNVNPGPGEIIVMDMALDALMVELSTAVVSASKYEQRLSDVTVSMEVLKPGFIEKQNIYQLDDALKLLPGVDVLDGQASIRGGSGYAYGAGSRVMLLVDDLPMLTGDVNEVKWNFIPVELIGQVEVIKGASSALYGSSALNGVINVRTATPGEKPETTVNLSAGFYNRPKRDELSWWWDRVPFFGGLKMSHLRKAGPFDLTFGLNVSGDEGYRTDNYSRYGRFTAGLRYNPPKLKGLSTGLHTSFQFQRTCDFLIWTDADSGALVQSPVSVSPTDGIRFNLDPYVTYFDHRECSHSLLTRYYKVNNVFNDDHDKDNGSDYFYGEYQYQRQFKNDLHWIIGTSGSYTLGNSELYGDHTGSAFALFSQVDHHIFKGFAVSLGARWEHYSLDQDGNESKPVLRAGINYEAAKATFIRASFGQGYRFPSMAEKYTSTSLGNLNIFPNPDLRSESGWSAEAGLQQGYRIGNWKGYIDFAAFWTEYQEMIEFVFGVYVPDSNTIPTLDNLGFKSINIGAAKITGIDVSINGSGKAGNVLFNYFAGYTYMNPIDLSSDTVEDQILKYRYLHSAKADLEAIFNKFNSGLTVSYQSFMERIDEAFEEEILGQEIFPGMKEYRAENNQGQVVLDFRFGWQFTPSSCISLIIKNLFNEEYMGRPGDIQPPRNISLQYILKI